MLDTVSEYPLLASLGALIGVLGFHSALTNPTRRLHLVRIPFKSTVIDGDIRLERRSRLTVRQGTLSRALAYYKCASHIIANRYAGGRKARKGALNEVIARIHAVRFDPRSAYLISGDHFNVLYPRNLGVFYHAVLDDRTALDEQDWEHRQRIYLQTVAFALDAFSKRGDCSTTIVPIGLGAVSCVDIYRYPSDALYGILFALTMLIDNSPIAIRYPFMSETRRPLATREAARQLIVEHSRALAALLKRYRATVYDEQVGLVRRDRSFSGAKDASLRESAFYDNVIFWCVCSMARALGIAGADDIDTASLKARIIDAFWDPQAGIFREDLTEGGPRFSGDWLCAIFTGFLDARDGRERDMIEGNVSFAERHGLAHPFPLRYQEQSGGSRPLIIRLAAAEYGGMTIWSFWGAEHIKALLLLERYGGDTAWGAQARRHIAAYESRIERFRGYPEVYDAAGEILRTPFYKSVRQTGWVVGFEQAQLMAREAKG